METKNTLEDKILTAIKSGELKMRPRWHFFLKSAFLLTGAIALFTILLYLTSFIIFVLHRNGTWFLPAFGFITTRAFLSSLPWLLIGLAVGLVIFLESLVQRFSFGYRRPLIYTAVGAGALILVGSLIIVRTPFHEKFSASLYESFGHEMFEEIHPCTITETGEDEFSCFDNEGRALNVSLNEETILPFKTKFNPEDTVVIFGREEVSGQIKARGVRAVEARNLRPFKHPIKNMRPR